MTELQPIIVFHSRHFVRHLGIYKRICANLLQLMSGVITHNSVKNEVSILISGWVSAKYSVSRPRRLYRRHLYTVQEIHVQCTGVFCTLVVWTCNVYIQTSSRQFPSYIFLQEMWLTNSGAFVILFVFDHRPESPCGDVCTRSSGEQWVANIRNSLTTRPAFFEDLMHSPVLLIN